VANLSLGGFFVAAGHPLPLGQVVSMRLHLPARAVALDVAVAWRNEVEAPRNPALPGGFGVAIRRIDMADKLALVEYLRAHERPGAAAETTAVPAATGVAAAVAAGAPRAKKRARTARGRSEG
jgi:hypothetical protein